MNRIKKHVKAHLSIKGDGEVGSKTTGSFFAPGAHWMVVLLMDRFLS